MMNHFASQAQLIEALESLNQRPFGQNEESSEVIIHRPQEASRVTSLDFLRDQRTQVKVESHAGPAAQHTNWVNLSALKKSFSGDSTLGRRGDLRYEVSMTAIVYTRTASFRTESVDVSGSGVQFKDQLPEEFINRPIEILFVHEDPHTGRKTHLILQGVAVGHGLNTPRAKFNRLAPRLSQILQRLLKLAV